jgi:hypothetical protein
MERIQRPRSQLRSRRGDIRRWSSLRRRSEMRQYNVRGVLRFRTAGYLLFELRNQGVLTPTLAPTILCLLYALQTAQSSAPLIPECQLEVVAVDAFGMAVTDATYRLKDNPAEHATEKLNEAACGGVKIVVKASFFWPKEFEIDLSPGRTHFVAQLDFRELAGGKTAQYSVNFVIADYNPALQCDRVNVVSLFEPRWRTGSRVTARGFFRLEGIPRGVYGFALVGRKAPCGATTAVINGVPGGEVVLHVNR